MLRYPITFVTILLAIIIGISSAGIFCETQEECNDVAMKSPPYIPAYVGDHDTTRGCFQKNGNVFWADGTEEEIRDVALPGIQHRVYCDYDELQNTLSASGTMFYLGISVAIVMMMAPLLL